MMTRMVRVWFLAIFSIGGAAPPGITASAQEGFFVKAVAEKKIAKMPGGPLYWHVESFPTLAEAHAAVTPMSLAAGVEGKAWLLTLARKNGGHVSTPGATRVAEIGPVPVVTAPLY